MVNGGELKVEHGHGGWRDMLVRIRRPSGPASQLQPHQYGQALQFGLFDLARLETLILRQVAGDFFNLDPGEDDDA